MANVFASRKLKELDSSVILQTLAMLTMGGATFEEALLAQIEDETNSKIKKILQEAKTLHIDRQEPLSEALMSLQIISQSEHRMMEEVPEFSDAVEIILEMRKSKGKINSSFHQTATVFVIVLSAIFALSYFISDVLIDKIESLDKRVEHDYLYFVEHPAVFLYGIAILIIGYVLFISYYFYLLKNDLGKLYRFFPLKVYEDFPIFLRQIKIYMQQREMNDEKTAKELARFGSPEHMRMVFTTDSRRHFNGFSERFRAFNLPNKIMLFFETADKNDPDEMFKVNPLVKDVYSQKSVSVVDFLIGYCEKTLNESVDRFLNTRWKMGFRKIVYFSLMTIFVLLAGSMYYTLMTSLDDLTKKTETKYGRG